MGFGHFGPGGCCCSVCEGFGTYDESFTEPFTGGTLDAEWTEQNPFTGSAMDITLGGSYVAASDSHSSSVQNSAVKIYRHVQKVNPTVDVIRYGVTVVKNGDFTSDIVFPVPARTYNWAIILNISDPIASGAAFIASFAWSKVVLPVGFGSSTTHTRSFYSANQNSETDSVEVADGSDMEVLIDFGAGEVEFIVNAVTVKTQTFTVPSLYTATPFGCDIVAAFSVSHTYTDTTATMESEMDDAFCEITSS